MVAGTRRVPRHLHKSQRGAALSEYLPPLVFGVMLTMGAWQQYGGVVREQMARVSSQFAEHYYRGWFWPPETPPAHTPWGAPGNGTQGSDSPATGSQGSGGDPQDGGATSGDSDSDNPTDSVGTENPFDPGSNNNGGLGNNFGNSGGAGSSAPPSCAANTTAPGFSAVAPSNASTFTALGNPIDIGTGNKFQAEADYRNVGSDALTFIRYYNSVLGHRDTGLGHGWRHSYQRSIEVDESQRSATAWRDDGTQYTFTLHETNDADKAAEATAPRGVIDHLERSADGWIYRTGNGDREHYDGSGRLQQIEFSTGRRHTLHYNAAGRLQTIDDGRGNTLALTWQAEHLQTVALPTQQQLQYGYDETLNLSTVTHSHTRLQRLLTIFTRATTERRYHYEDRRHPTALTGLDDASGARYATWAYDNAGRAVLSQHGDGAEQIRIDYRTPAPDSRRREVAVTNALGLTTVYTLEPTGSGRYRLRDVDGQPGIDCPAVRHHHRYDEQGFVKAQWNAERIGSIYQRNARGLIEREEHGLRFGVDERPSRVVGSRRIERTWDDQQPWLLSETRYSWQTGQAHPQGQWQPVTQRTFHYGERGRVLADTLTDLTEQTLPATTGREALVSRAQDAQERPTGREALVSRAQDAQERPTNVKQRQRTYDYQFEDASATQLRTLIARDGNGNATTYRYANDQLQSIENALGHTTLFQRYNAHGQPEQVQLPNAQTLTIAYNASGLPIQLERRHQGEREITRLTYDAANRLTHLARPDDGELHYTYNAAGQLTQIENNWAETIALTPNALHGQWEVQQVRDAMGEPVRRHTRSFNAMGQLVAVLGNQQQQTAFTYNASGDLIAASEGHQDPAQAHLRHTTRAIYDTQHRLLELIDAAGYSTHYARSPSGEIETITDAGQGSPSAASAGRAGAAAGQGSPSVASAGRAGATANNITRYIRNGFGEVIELDSPTTGTVIKYYDANGNLVENRGVNGQGVRFEYDALNRLTRVDYPGEQHDIHYSYDHTDAAHGNGLQQITRVETTRQTIDYRYDAFGRKIEETTRDKNHSGNKNDSDKFTQPTTLKYDYLPGNRLSKITYPDGSVVHYHYNRDRIDKSTYTDASTGKNTTIVKNIAYAPFGAPIGWTYGNGLRQSQSLDQDGRVESIALTQTGFNRNATLWQQQYRYDLYQNIEQIRREEATNAITQVFAYDKMDRLVDEQGGGDDKRYYYDPLGNRESSAGVNMPELNYDAAGNIAVAKSENAIRRYRYDAYNKPVAIYDDNQITALYRYNAFGWREQKKTYRGSELSRVHYVYSSAGKLLREHHLGEQQKSINYIWLGPIPIAQIEHRIEGAPRFIYLHADHLTAPRIATGTDQRIIWRWHSDAFGNVDPEQDPDGDGVQTQINLRFAGQYADTESGLFYNLHRYYDPKQGRYTQSDPLGQLASMNPYSYVDANPVNWLDPLGLAKLQYVLIDTFGGDPTAASKRTIKDGIDTRMLHFAVYVTDIAGRPGAGFIYDPSGIYSGLDYSGAVTWNEASGDKWSDFSSFYISGYGDNNAFNTGAWAITDYNDDDAAKFYDALKGDGTTACLNPAPPNSPIGNGSSPTNPFTPKPNTPVDVKSYVNNLPNLPQGFYAMEHFNFPTIVHKLTKPVFEVADLPDTNDTAFVSVSWFPDTFNNEGNDDPTTIYYTRKPQKLEKPPGSGKAIDQSGVTIGRGYDLGQQTASDVKNLLARIGLSNDQRQLLQKAVGIKGDPHITFYNENAAQLKAIGFTREQQYLIYMQAISKAYREAERKYNDYVKADIRWDDLDSKTQDTLTDMQYRGDFRNISVNTTEKASTPFDDFAFAQAFRNAVSSNDMGDFCRVMKSDNWTKEKPAWNVPENRWSERVKPLLINGQCPP